MDTSGRSFSCSKIEDPTNFCITDQTSSSLPSSLTDDWKARNPDLLLEETSTPERRLSNESQKFVQNCGPDCMITQRIVDRLLARMLHLENERSELLAANRSWAVQFEMVQDKHRLEVTKLKQDLEFVKCENKRKSSQSVDREKRTSTSIADSRDQLNLLSHQAEVYREDFVEERKARVRAHAQIEALRSELKRERKSRVKLSAIVNQTKACSESPQTLS